MKAMVLESARQQLRLQEIDRPVAGPGQVLLRLHACGLCRTDLHIVDGELHDPKLPLVLGHQAVGRVEESGEGTALELSARVGVPWLGWTCGRCRFCSNSQENLCEQALFTGYTVDGGFAEYMVADERFCIPIPPRFPDRQAAPLLCAGLIGYRALRKAGEAKRLGLYGFGSAAHLMAQVAVYQGRQVFAFTREGDNETQEFAKSLGADWAGPSTQDPPEELDAAIIFAPVGALVPAALRAVRKGGRVVCGGIHMSDIPGFPYADLWGERELVSVANLTRQDGKEFLQLAAEIPLESTTQLYRLEEANQALEDLRKGRVNGSLVLACD